MNKLQAKLFGKKSEKLKKIVKTYLGADEDSTFLRTNFAFEMASTFRI